MSAGVGILLITIGPKVITGDETLLDVSTEMIWKYQIPFGRVVRALVVAVSTIPSGIVFVALFQTYEYPATAMLSVDAVHVTRMVVLRVVVAVVVALTDVGIVGGIVSGPTTTVEVAKKALRVDVARTLLNV